MESHVPVRCSSGSASALTVPIDQIKIGNDDLSQYSNGESLEYLVKDLASIESSLGEYDIDPTSFYELNRPHGPKVKDRYFGEQARVYFHGRTQFIHRQKKIMQYSKNQASSKELFFDNENSIKEEDYPFAVPATPQHGRTSPSMDIDDECSIESNVDFDDSSSQCSATSFQSHSSSSSSYTSKYAHEFPSPCAKLSMKMSPRSVFISNCLDQNLNPRASLLLRKRIGKSIDLQHMNIGDKIAILLGECLGDMPYVESINVDDNSLTDVGVSALLKSMSKISTLTSVNLSRNKMDDNASIALAALVSSPTCQLKTLILQKADIDDPEGVKFLLHLMKNKTITDIDLSDNKIGSSENRRATMPSFISCAESFAKILSSTDCRLERLVLKWNNIRGQSATSLSRSLSANRTLKYLDISFNSLGQDGGEFLGEALIDNNSLHTLNISSNSINATAAFTICNGIVLNRSIRKAIFDDNPIGEAGAQALMVIPIKVGNRVNISAKRCNISIRDDDCLFLHAQPLGSYDLDLAKPYHRAVAFAILDIAAHHSTYVLKSCTHERCHGQPIPLNLIQSVLKDTEKFLDERQQRTLDTLRRFRDAAIDDKKARQLFLEADSDNSGEIDSKELSWLLHNLDMDQANSYKELDSRGCLVDDFLAAYSLRETDAIRLPELLSFIKSQYSDTVSRISDLSDELAMCSYSTSGIGSVEKYLPDKEGYLHVELIDGYIRKEFYAKMGDSDFRCASKVVSSNPSILLSYTINNTKLRLSEALLMYNTMVTEGGQPTVTLGKILTRMDSPLDAKRLIQTVLESDRNFDRLKWEVLKNILGFSLRPIIGVYNGFYILDLSKELDRNCLGILFEHNAICSASRQREQLQSLGDCHVGDTSQHRNWSCFRNEYFNNKPVAIDAKDFSPPPSAGRLMFDFSSTSRPEYNDDLIVLSDVKCIQNLKRLGLLRSESNYSPDIDMTLATNSMAKMKRKLAKVNEFKGRVYFELDKQRAQAMGKSSDHFYDNLATRMQLYETGVQGEIIKASENKALFLVNTTNPSLTHDDSNSEEITVIAKQAVIKPIELSDADQLQLILSSPKVSRQAKASRSWEMLEMVFAGTWMTCMQLALVLKYFPWHDVSRAKCFGSYQLEVVVSLFPRLIDIYNIEVVLKQLKPSDLGALFCRLGWLNLFNPLKPDGYWELNFGRYEERQIAKILITLSVIEPGINWIDKTFSWSRHAHSTPGWELTEPLTVDSTCLTSGILLLRYFSGEGASINRCKPRIDLRFALCSLVLLDESDIQAEQHSNNCSRNYDIIDDEGRSDIMNSESASALTTDCDDRELEEIVAMDVAEVNGSTSFQHLNATAAESQGRTERCTESQIDKESLKLDQSVTEVISKMAAGKIGAEFMLANIHWWHNLLTPLVPVIPASATH